MLIEESTHFIDIKIGKKEITRRHRGRATLTGESLHFLERFSIGKNIDRLEIEAFTLQVGDRVNTPRATRVDVNKKGSIFTHSPCHLARVGDGIKSGKRVNGENPQFYKGAAPH